MNSSPLVSINIPVYKCENYIYRCLESVKNQTYRNIEIILVNDCTPDNSIAIINEYISQNPELNIKLHHLEKNQGLSVVRNKGIDESSGKYIYMLDSDDYITADCIEKLVLNAEHYQSEITVGESICEFENSGERKQMFKISSQIDSIKGNNEIFNSFVDGVYPVIGPNKLYLRLFITNNNLRFIEGLYSQDELWAFHCAEKLESISFIKDITYIYFMNSGSTIFNKKKINFENHQTIVEWFSKSYRATNDQTRKKLIRKKLIGFKKLTLQMQYKSMRNDPEYWMQNYNRLKKAPSLTLSDYFSSDFTTQQKKENLLLNLPVNLGFKIFKKRYEG
ncbi:glycosyltransferase family 2 protein [Empedobacter brevis]|uniref:glycosyltransferase family 2 protein n=1 Tax=Empedobacter brevis TaxID=247 RepID=UPI00123D5EE8|nr:glycosyltransferase family 2 protein [Empedobacter brevis]QES91637.1 glycosyltransferase family 2 protein [Empedobacter brevis]